MKFILVDK